MADLPRSDAELRKEAERRLSNSSSEAPEEGDIETPESAAAIEVPPGLNAVQADAYRRAIQQWHSTKGAELGRKAADAQRDADRLKLERDSFAQQLALYKQQMAFLQQQSQAQQSNQRGSYSYQALKDLDEGQRSQLNSAIAELPEVRAMKEELAQMRFRNEQSALAMAETNMKANLDTLKGQLHGIEAEFEQLRPLMESTIRQYGYDYNNPNLLQDLKPAYDFLQNRLKQEQENAKRARGATSERPGLSSSRTQRRRPNFGKGRDIDVKAVYDWALEQHSRARE